MADKKHNFTRTEILAGMLVVSSVIVLAGFVAVIQGLRPPKETSTYYTRFTKTIGLKEGGKVKWGGLEVGEVVDMAPDEQDQTQIRVTFNMAPHVPVNKDSVATIEQMSLTAEKHLEVSTGSSEAVRLKPESFVTSETLSGAIIDMPDIGGVVAQVETLLEDIIDFLGVEEAQEREAKGEEEFAKIARIASDVRQTLNEGTGLLGDVRTVIEEERPNISSILTKVTEIEDSTNALIADINTLVKENRPNIASSVEKVDSILGDVEGVTGRLESRLETLLATLEGIMSNAELLTGDAQEMLDSNRSAIDDIMQDLKITIQHLKAFSRTMAEQPQAVIRGKALEGRK